MFYAHGCVLKIQASALAAFAEGYDRDTRIPIEGVDPATFQQLLLLRYVYGGELPDSDQLRKDARALIDAVDQFGCTNLKLAAEAELTASGITIETASDLILYADAKNCALLKEAAIDFFVANSEEVMESDGYANVKESPAILNELMTAGFIGSKKRSAPSEAGERDYKRMRVGTLRQKLEEKGLELDGDKEMLISRLERAEARENDDDNSIISIE